MAKHTRILIFDFESFFFLLYGIILMFRRIGRSQMWYVIQTTTGKEEELAAVIKKQLPKASYEACFVIKRQLLKRLGGEWRKVRECLFSSYVFIETKDSAQLFFKLKGIPEFAKILGNKCGNETREFIPMEKDEEDFLKSILDEDDTVQLSRLLLDEQGAVISIEGPLALFQERIVKVNLRKRFAVVELFLGGQRRTAMLGIEIEG